MNVFGCWYPVMIFIKILKGTAVKESSGIPEIHWRTNEYNLRHVLYMYLSANGISYEHVLFWGNTHMHLYSITKMHIFIYVRDAILTLTQASTNFRSAWKTCSSGRASILVQKVRKLTEVPTMERLSSLMFCPFTTGWEITFITPASFSTRNNSSAIELKHEPDGEGMNWIVNRSTVPRAMVSCSKNIWSWK